MCRVRRSAGILKRDRKFQFFFSFFFSFDLSKLFTHTHTHTQSINYHSPSFSSSFRRCVKESYFVPFFFLSISFHYYSSSSYHYYYDTARSAYIICARRGPGNAETHSPGRIFDFRLISNRVAESKEKGEEETVAGFLMLLLFPSCLFRRSSSSSYSAGFFLSLFL